jgi:hypothetical protein
MARADKALLQNIGRRNEIEREGAHGQGDHGAEYTPPAHAVESRAVTGQLLALDTLLLRGLIRDSGLSVEEFKGAAVAVHPPW